MRIFLSGTFLGRISEFGQFFHEFWIIVEQSIFIVEKRLPYICGKSSIFDEEYDDEKIKSFAWVLSNILKCF